jgi:flagellar capping protein FliD
MKTYVAGLQQNATSLGGIDTATDNGRIKSQLQDFASQYNSWVQRFDADMRSGGVLAGTRAAQISRYELDQSIKNIFHGASDGLQGLRDLGFSIDPATGLATLDTAKLDSVLSSNRLGAIHVLQQFGANFAKAAELLGSTGNFIARQLDNLSRAIDYIDDNKPALQAEFGLGDPARSSGQVAQALAEYKQSYA